MPTVPSCGSRHTLCSQVSLAYGQRWGTCLSLLGAG